MQIFIKLQNPPGLKRRQLITALDNIYSGTENLGNNIYGFVKWLHSGIQCLNQYFIQTHVESPVTLLGKHPKDEDW